MSCGSQLRMEAEPAESRGFIVEADGEALRFTAPSRRQAILWATALEVAAGYVEANVEDTREAMAVSSDGDGTGFKASDASASAARAAVLGSLDEYFFDPSAIQPVLAVSHHARLGFLEPYLLGPEAERRWQKRRLKWIFGFIDSDGAGTLPVPKIHLLWHELNINPHEGQQVLSAVLRQEKQGRRAGGGRQIGGGRVVNLQDWVKMLTLVDDQHIKAVYRAVRMDLCDWQRSASIRSNNEEDLALSKKFGQEQIGADSLLRFFIHVQQVWPPPSLQQVQRLLSRLPSAKEQSLSTEAFAQLLCSPGNALADPEKRSLFQDMTLPLFAYFVDTSHNTYLEGREVLANVDWIYMVQLESCKKLGHKINHIKSTSNPCIILNPIDAMFPMTTKIAGFQGNQLSSRSSVLRYVEVLRAGCRSVEVDVWDGSNGEPMVKHGYTVTTEVGVGGMR